jgi:aminopeptidase N
MSSRVRPVRRPLRRAAAALLLTPATAGLAPDAHALAPDVESAASCRAEALGDEFHPLTGTPGLHIERYRTHLRFAPTLHDYTALTTVDAVATRPLDCVSLDFAGGSVDSADVAGVPAGTRQVGAKLVVTLPAEVEPGAPVRLTLATHSAVVPAGLLRPDPYSPGVFSFHGVVQLIGQPTSSGHTLVPLADHPSQKAPWRIVVDTPVRDHAAVSGVLVSQRRLGETRRMTYRTASTKPDVLQVAVGDLVEVGRGRADGVRLRSWVPRGDRASTRAALAEIPGQLAWMRRRVGAFPFSTYGVVATPAGGELECQTLTLLAAHELSRPYEVGAVMLHELAHEWFGDSVSISRWRDLWLAEGHATYYQLLWEHRHRSARALRQDVADEYATAVRQVARFGPVARPYPNVGQHADLAPYRSAAYTGGAVALHALRQRIGERAFEAVERSYVRGFRHGTASTSDYLRVVGRVAGRGAAAYLRSWLTSTKLPRLPTD